MQRRGTLVLLFAVLVVAGLLWREGMPELQGPPSQAALEQELFKPLISIDPLAVTGVTLTNGAQSRRVERPPGGWTEVEDGARIAGFLKELKDLGRVHDIAATPEELADFGLAPPAKRIELQLASQSVSIELGNHNPSTTGVYVRIDQHGDVILAGALLEWEFDKLWRALSGQ